MIIYIIGATNKKIRRRGLGGTEEASLQNAQIPPPRKARLELSPTSATSHAVPIEGITPACPVKVACPPWGLGPSAMPGRGWPAPTAMGHCRRRGARGRPKGCAGEGMGLGRREGDIYSLTYSIIRKQILTNIANKIKMYCQMLMVFDKQHSFTKKGVVLRKKKVPATLND